MYHGMSWSRNPLMSTVPNVKCTYFCVSVRWLGHQWRVCVCVCLFHTRTPWLYRNIHQLHHQHRHPFALAAQDASGAELVSLLLLAMASAWLLGCHPLSEAVFHLANTWLAVEDHSGYNLPWALHRLLPFMGGSPYHQDHHVLFRGNYAPYFIHWDQFFGTYYSVNDPLEQWPTPEKKSVKDEWWLLRAALTFSFSQTSESGPQNQLVEYSSGRRERLQKHPRVTDLSVTYVYYSFGSCDGTRWWRCV